MPRIKSPAIAALANGTAMNAADIAQAIVATTTAQVNAFFPNVNALLIILNVFLDIYEFIMGSIESVLPPEADSTF